MSAPIRIRLTVLYVLVLAAIIAALTAFVITRLRADLIASVDANLHTAAAQIALAYHNEGRLEFIDTAQTVLPGSRSEPAGAACGSSYSLQCEAFLCRPLYYAKLVAVENA